MDNAYELKLLVKAVDFAARKHKDQRRKDKEASPYINHPIALAGVLCNEGHVTNIAVICGALLHDTIEDTATTAEEIENEFGSLIKNIVLEVTDDTSLPGPERKRLQVEHAEHLTEGAKLVKLADKIANLRDIVQHPPAGWSLERRQRYFDWAKLVVDQVRGVHPVLESVFDAVYALRP